MIHLSTFDLALAACLVVMLALLTSRINTGMAWQIVIAAARTTVQLLLIGLVLKALFDSINPWWIGFTALFMLLAAGREVMARQQHRMSPLWGFGIGTLSMFLSSFAVTVFALLTIIGNDPWYAPQYSIPLLGMLLGNTMNGIAIGLDRLVQMAHDQRGQIEARLMLGASWNESIRELRHQSIRSGMIPIINAMAAAGIVSLPGMMTGQILAGAPPVEAVKYQILIMFLIASGTGLGTLAAVWASSRRLFDNRERLQLERLTGISSQNP